jgi:hypothetical protein
MIAINHRRFRAIVNHLIDLGASAGQIIRTLTAPFHFALCPSTTCACTWPDGLSATYTVGGWGALTPCPTADASIDPAWDGTMNHIGTGCVWWAADSEFDPLNINGYMLDITYTQILLRTTATPCRWELYIASTSLSNPTKLMWSGYKIGGSTPAGVYTFVASDCGNTEGTMTVT